MATLEEVITELLYDMDRLDLQPTARANARNVLFACHAASDFHRDLQLTDLQATTPNSPITTVLLPATFRTLQAVEAYDNTGAQVPLKYVRKVPQPYVDYQGFVDSVATYYLAGGNCVLTHAGYLPNSVALRYFAYPTFAVGSETAEVSTNSWMLEHNAAYFKAKLQEKLAGLTANTALYNVAKADAQAALMPLLASEDYGV